MERWFGWYDWLWLVLSPNLFHFVINFLEVLMGCDIWMFVETWFYFWISTGIKIIKISYFCINLSLLSIRNFHHLWILFNFFMFTIAHEQRVSAGYLIFLTMLRGPNAHLIYCYIIFRIHIQIMDVLIYIQHSASWILNLKCVHIVIR